MRKSRKMGYDLVKEKHLKAVHDDDLITLLSSLGCYDKLTQGKCVCFFCDDLLTLKNIGAIFPYEGEIQFSCNKESCLTSMVKLGRDGSDN